MLDGPLVFIHGSGCDKTVWSSQVHEFGGERKITLVDFPGRGEEPPSPTSSFHQIVEHTRRKLPATPAVVVGHSLGAAVALTLALANEESISGIVLVGAAPKVAIPESMSSDAERDFESVLEALRAALFHRATAPSSKETGIGIMRRLPPSALANDLRAAASFDFTHSARPLSVPALLICGSHDRVTPQTASATLQRLIGGGLEVIEGAGHMPMIEKPERFNEVLRAFLDGAPNPRPDSHTKRHRERI